MARHTVQETFQAELVSAVLRGEFRAIAKVISHVEDSSPHAVRYLRELFPHTGRALVVGVTGSPGTGKSTLVDAVAGYYRVEGRKVGIIAVDPTSPFSGGAILGDRIRMQSRSVDEGTFIRSMATRGHLGGLTGTASDVLCVLDAAGFDVILLETVGVGQDEVEVIRAAHVTLVLLVPGLGDDIQAMKAGIMEIGDVFVINKSDHPGVARIEAEMRALLAMAVRPDGWTPSVIKTVAINGVGIAECVRAIGDYQEFRRQSPFQQLRLVQIQRDRIVELARDRIEKVMRASNGMPQKLEEMARRVAAHSLDPFTAAEDLLRSAGFAPEAE